MPKFFANQDVEGTVTITGGDAAHIINVLRSRPGDEITVCDGHGVDMMCVVREIRNNNVILTVLDRTSAETEPEIRITLFQGLPKGDKMEYIIQKAVELGVYEIVPVVTERTVVKIDGGGSKKLERYNRVSQAAAKQCMRGMIPRVECFMDLKEAITYSKKLDMTFVAYENEDEIGIRDVLNGRDFKSAGVFIGPEGGFSHTEMDLFAENHIPSIMLGKRILRTETAGLAAVVILNYEMGAL